MGVPPETRLALDMGTERYRTDTFVHRYWHAFRFVLRREEEKKLENKKIRE
jgi:hypothetical protein